jgi:hypothetical protein
MALILLKSMQMSVCLQSHPVFARSSRKQCFSRSQLPLLRKPVSVLGQSDWRSLSRPPCPLLGYRSCRAVLLIEASRTSSSSGRRLTATWRHGQVEEPHSAQPDLQAAQEWHQEAEEIQILVKERGEKDLPCIYSPVKGICHRFLRASAASVMTEGHDS